MTDKYGADYLVAQSSSVGSSAFDQYVGRRVVLFCDEYVYKGKLVSTANDAVQLTDIEGMSSSRLLKQSDSWVSKHTINAFFVMHGSAE